MAFGRGRTEKASRQAPKAEPTPASTQAPTTEPSSASKQAPTTEAKPEPGAGLRGMKTTAAFRTLNFELYARPVSQT